MAAAIDALATGEGFVSTALPDVQLLRSFHYLSRRPMIYEPCLVFIAQGHKVANFGDRAITYDPDRFFLLNISAPFESETFAMPDRPLLGVAIKLDMLQIADLLLDMDKPTLSVEPPAIGQALSTTPDIDDAVLRLLQSMGAPEQRRILSAAIIREIFYHVLRGPGAASLREVVSVSGVQSRVARVTRQLHRDYREKHSVSDLAHGIGMGTSSFHAHFKAMTGISPLNYLKRIRLHHARLIMINENISVLAAADRVGYDSPSHFSREFKQLFGDSPGNVARAARAMLARSGQSQLRGILTFDPAEYAVDG